MINNNNNINIISQCKNNECFPYSLFAGYILWKNNNHNIELIQTYNINLDLVHNINNIYQQHTYFNTFYNNFIKLLIKYHFNIKNIFIILNQHHNNFLFFDIPVFVYKGVINYLIIFTNNNLKSLFNKIKNNL